MQDPAGHQPGLSHVNSWLTSRLCCSEISLSAEKTWARLRCAVRSGGFTGSETIGSLWWNETPVIFSVHLKAWWLVLWGALKAKDMMFSTSIIDVYAVFMSVFMSVYQQYRRDALICFSEDHIVWRNVCIRPVFCGNLCNKGNWTEAALSLFSNLWTDLQLQLESPYLYTQRHTSSSEMNNRPLFDTAVHS